MFTVDDTTADTTNATELEKPPPIYTQAQVIKPLVELLEQQARINNFVLKQLKDNQIKIQLKRSEHYRKIVNALKSKNADFHTYQPKADRSFKIIFRGVTCRSKLDV